MPAIETRDLRVRAATTEILCGITLRIDPGELVGVLGPNGAGKSTLLKALTGLIRFSGRVEMLGQEVNELSSAARTRLRRRIGYVPQMHDRPVSVLPLTVQQVVELGRCGARGGGWAGGDETLCREVMSEMRLSNIAQRSFTVLSGGEQRKTHLARAVAQRPEILLLDEPAGHLDFRSQEEITALIAELWRRHHMTILMVTHDLRHLPAGLQRVALLKEGRLLCLDEPNAVLTDETLSDLYELPLRVMRIGERYVALPREAV